MRLNPQVISNFGPMSGDDGQDIRAEGGTSPAEGPWPDLERDLRYYASYLQGIAHEILDSGTSKYPVFVAFESGNPELGRLVLDHRQLDTKWSVRASAMEEFINRKVLGLEQFARFKKSWKDPNDFMCVFVLDPQQPSFVYFPYPAHYAHDEEL